MNLKRMEWDHVMSLDDHVMRSEAEFSPWLQDNFLVGSSTIGLGQIILGYLNRLYSGWVSVRVWGFGLWVGLRWQIYRFGFKNRVVLCVKIFGENIFCKIFQKFFFQN